MNKYMVDLNWYGEVIQIYTTAKSERSAYIQAIGKLAISKDYGFRVVDHYFRGTDRFKITKI